MQDHPYDTDRAEVLPFLPTIAATVLDVGCSRGGFCALIKKTRPDTTVWGLEPHPVAAKAASRRADHIITGYFPTSVPADAPKFDAIFFNDVLEHAIDPWGMLAAACPMLAREGRVIASIPNLRYWPVLEGLLLRGDFTYTETGVLDKTHLRFFTKRTMHALFTRAGFAVERCEPINVSQHWAARTVGSMFGTFGEELRAQQYVLVGRPSSALS